MASIFWWAFFFGGHLGGPSLLSDGVGESAVEERLHDVLQGRAAGLGARLRGQEDVGRTVLAMVQMTSFFEDAQQRTPEDRAALRQPRPPWPRRVRK